MTDLITTELAQRMRDYLDTANISGVKLLHLTTDELGGLLDSMAAKDKQNMFLKEQLEQLANFNPDWDRLEAATESLREHAAELKAARERIAELEALPEQQPVAYTDSEELRFPHATSDMWPTPLGHGRDIPLYTDAPATRPVTVKRPVTKCIGWVKEAIHEHDEKWIEILRAAGITIAEGE